MQEFYAVLKSNTLFCGFSDSEMQALLTRLGAVKRSFKKGGTVRKSETEVEEIGIVVRGLVYLSKTDINGKRVILSEVERGKSFGESLSLISQDNSPIEITAAKDSVVVFLPAKSILQEAFDADEQMQKRLIKNFICLLAEKIFLLQIKNDILSQKTTKEKLLLYFEYSSKVAKSKRFKIHFSREELADFLGLNASAVSRELGRLRDEGILVFRKNTFKLKD